MKKQIPKEVIIVGIVAIAGINVAALLNGINGTLTALCVGAIALAIGIILPQPKLK